MVQSTQIPFAIIGKRGYNPPRSFGAWRSPASALAWGARGRRFKSSRPDTRVRKTVLAGDGFVFKLSANPRQSSRIFKWISGHSRIKFMESNEPIYPSLSPTPSTNRHSIISLVLGILTLLTVCGGMVPVPFTGFICFPFSFLFGLLALIFGVISLNTIRRNNEAGKPMAWVGILTGGFIFLCMLCMLVALISLFIFAPERVPPILQGYQL